MIGPNVIQAIIDNTGKFLQMLSRMDVLTKIMIREQLERIPLSVCTLHSRFTCDLVWC